MTEQSGSEHDDYSIRDDQITAMNELDRLQKTNPDDWTEELDKKFLEALQEPGPDYEETLARLNQLNAELERQPSPDESRAPRSRVRFSAELIQVAPSPSPPPPLSPTPPEQQPDAEADADPQDSPGDHRQLVETDGGGDQPDSGKVLLVSDGGEYKYVDGKEVLADSDTDSDDLELSNRDSESNGEQPGRPGSAAASGQRWTSNRPSSVNGSSGRPSSAPSNNGGQDERERDNELAFQAWLRAKREQQRQERREQLERQRREEAEAQERAHRQENGVAFQAWLRAKREQQREERERQEAEWQQQQKEQDKQERQRAGKPSLENWLQTKRKQQKKEKKYHEMEREEMMEHSETHTSRQCRKAFKRWLRRKEEQKRYEEMCERQRARITQLALRRSRRSQELANALLVSGSYKYMDYYGYR